MDIHGPQRMKHPDFSSSSTLSLMFVVFSEMPWNFGRNNVSYWMNRINFVKHTDFSSQSFNLSNFWNAEWDFYTKNVPYHQAFDKEIHKEQIRLFTNK